MKAFIKHVIFIALVCIALMVLVEFALNNFDESQAQARMQYSVSGCEPGETGYGAPPKARAMGDGKLLMEHYLDYDCCADVRVEFSRLKQELNFTEANYGEECECSCTYFVEAEVSGLNPGEYDVNVFGVNNQTLLRETIPIK